MKEYIRSEEDCAEQCANKVCLRCGNSLSPIETVDNSKRPTFWPGCMKCSIFSMGTSKEIYSKAKEISRDYYNISMDDLCCIVDRLYADLEAALKEKDRTIRRLRNDLCDRIAYEAAVVDNNALNNHLVALAHERDELQAMFVAGEPPYYTKWKEVTAERDALKKTIKVLEDVLNADYPTPEQINEVALKTAEDYARAGRRLK